MKVFCISVIFSIFVCDLTFGTFIVLVNVSPRAACFRRLLAGKRVSRGFVRRSLFCERVEDCQLECGEEKRFICEGFNYRLDPRGRGKGECELLDVPLHRLDIGRDVYPDPDYDYYERDRNAAPATCRPSYPDYGGRPPSYPRPLPHRPPYDEYDHRRPAYGRPSYDRRPTYDRRPDYDRIRPIYHPDYDRRGDTNYQTHGYSHTPIDRNDDIYHGTQYLPPNPSPKPIFPYDHKSPHKPYGYSMVDKYGHKPWDIRQGHNNNHFDYERRNYYLPPQVGGTKDWGKYGGSYGNFGYNYDNRRYDHKSPVPLLPPPKTGGYLPVPTLEINLIHQGPNIYDIGENLILPVEPRFPNPNYLKDECSLRSATGFKLSKGVVKKYYAVPNIYECELLCFKERGFPCASYAFRYTISLSSPSDNCYLSNRNYKELNYYTDLQPDRDFDIYTMNNMNKCASPVASPREESECFWRIRSGQKLDRRVIRDFINVKTIVDCQIACIKSSKFTCRAFSFRFGSPRFESMNSKNCQLTDWPFYELDPKIDFIPDPGFEVYERGSFGHGCEPYHFGIRGKVPPSAAAEADQLCYIGFGTPARLLPQATRKALKVKSELDCKIECSRLRERTLFQCMSFSFRSVPKGDANCLLSDIYQRDLLPQIDFVHDPDSWLFAWDNFNPQCVKLAQKPLHNIHDNHIGREDVEGRYPNLGIHTALDTWRAYSVSGWPCKRGHLCQENREAGFWFCKLEGGNADSWDYCCRPDHQCGYSSGFSYPWCYVGPERTQWRKCSDRYYPYIHNLIDRLDTIHHQTPQLYLPEQPPIAWTPDEGHYLPIHEHTPLVRPAFRPDRPPAPPQEKPPELSLDNYEMQFDEQFLAPPKPGGFGQPRHWPVSYLHKDMPPNITNAEPRLMASNRNIDTKTALTAIEKLIDVINSNDLKHIQYQITNESNSMDDVLFVKIPLPSNFTRNNVGEAKKDNITETPKTAVKRFSKTLEVFTPPPAVSEKQSLGTRVPVYRKGYVTRTNVTSHGHSTHLKVL